VLCKFENVRVLETGAYEIEGSDESYRWLDCYDNDPKAREKVIRFGVAKEVPEFELGFGDLVDLVCDVRNETKVLKGTDRTFVRHNVRVQHLQASKAAANGRGSTERVQTPAAA